jgi:hypothetical protein
MQVKVSDFLNVFIGVGPDPTKGCVLTVEYMYKMLCRFEVVLLGARNERTEKRTQKIETALLGVTAVKRSRKSEAEAGEARRGASCTTNDEDSS